MHVQLNVLFWSYSRSGSRVWPVFLATWQKRTLNPTFVSSSLVCAYVGSFLGVVVLFSLLVFWDWLDSRWWFLGYDAQWISSRHWRDSCELLYVLKLASGNVVRRRGAIIQLCDSTPSLSWRHQRDLIMPVCRQHLPRGTVFRGLKETLAKWNQTIPVNGC